MPTPSRVNFVEATTWNGSSGTTYASPAQSVTAGHTLVACVGGYATGGQAVTGITDTAGHTYTKVAHVFNSSDNYRQEVWVAATITTHAANVVTATWSAALGFRAIVVMQYAGLDPTTPLDDTEQTTTGPPFTTPTLTGTTAEAVHVLMTRWGLGDSGFPAGFTKFTTPGGSVAEVADKIVTGGAFIGTYTVTGNYLVLAVIFRTLGTVTVTVPDVVDELEADAVTAIEAVGLTVGTVGAVVSATVTAGHVVSQSPAAGSAVALGSAVDLLVALTPGLVVTIDGVIRQLRIDSLVIRATINGVDRFSGTLVLLDSGTRPALGDEITIDEDGVRLFGGVLDGVDESHIVQGRDLQLALSASDFNVYPDRRFVTTLEAPAGTTLKAALELLVPYLTTYGVTLSPTQAVGPTLEGGSWPFRTVTDVLTELSTTTGWVWQIDYTKVLSMWEPGSDLAPFDLLADDSAGVTVGDITVEPGATEYANRIIVRGGPDGPRDQEDNYFSDGVSPTFALRYPFISHYGFVWVVPLLPAPPTAAPSGLMVSVQGTAGTTTVTYAVSAYNAGGEGPKTSNVTISTAPNVLGAVDKVKVEWSAVAGATGYVIYGRTGTSTYLDINILGEISYYDDQDHDTEKPGPPSASALGLDFGHPEAMSDTPGAADWWFDASADPPTFTRNAGPMPAGYEVRIRYLVQFPIVVTADDLPAQAARGIHELLHAEPDVIYPPTLQAIADGLLPKHVQPQRLVHYVTREAGLRVGQSQTLEVPRRQLDGLFFITELETRSIAAHRPGIVPASPILLRTVTLQETQTYQGSWRDIYLQWAQGGGGGGTGGATTGAGSIISAPATSAIHHATHEPGGVDALQLTATSRLFGRATAGAGAVEEITIGDNLRLTGTTLSATSRSSSLVNYSFSTVTSAPPGTDQLRFNAGYPYTAVTKVWMRIITADGQDVYRGLLLVPAGSTLLVQDKNDHTQYAQFTTTAAAVDFTTYVEFAVAHVAHGSSIGGGQLVLVQNVWPPAAGGHHATHEPGGSDAITALDGSVLTTGTVASARLPARIGAVGIVIDGGGSAITSGVKGDLYIPFACTITASTLIADVSGSVVLDLKVSASYATTPTTSIVASAPPTLSSASTAQDGTLTGWTVSVAAGSRLRYSVTSASTITRLTHTLTVQAT